MKKSIKIQQPENGGELELLLKGDLVKVTVEMSNERIMHYYIDPFEEERIFLVERGLNQAKVLVVYKKDIVVKKGGILSIPKNCEEASFSGTFSHTDEYYFGEKVEIIS